MMVTDLIQRIKGAVKRLASGETTHVKWKYLNWLASVMLVIGIGLGLYVRATESPDFRIWLISLISIAILAIVVAMSFYFSMRRLFIAVAYMWCGYFLGIVGLHEGQDGVGGSIPIESHLSSGASGNLIGISSPVGGTRFRMSTHTNDGSVANDVSTIFLAASLLMRAIVLLSRWMLGMPQTNFINNGSPFVLIKFEEFFEWLGFCIACVQYDDYLALWLLNCGLAAGAVAVRLKSLLGFLNLVVYFFVVSFLVVPQLLPHLHLSLPAGLVYVGHLTVEPLFSLYFSSAHLVERCWSLMRLSGFCRHSLLMLLTFIELTFCISCAAFIKNHQEWIIMIPIFLFFALLWLSFHILLFITLWQLMRKISVCNRTYDVMAPANISTIAAVATAPNSPIASNSQDSPMRSAAAAADGTVSVDMEGPRAGDDITSSCESLLGKGAGIDASSMLQIMASKGVRHFSLVSYRVVCLSLFTTVVLGLVTWETRNALTMGLLLFVLPLESIIVSAFTEMASSLGGTCIGYAIVAPVVQQNPDRTVTVVPPWAMAEAASRCTLQLNLLQRFFAEHMIENFGCDYSSAGLSSEAVLIKLRSFFQRVTLDGPKYDTYFLYYSGHTFPNGDWALADGGIFKLQSLLDLWDECVGRGFDSRLLLVVDSAHAAQWLRNVRKLPHSYVGLQTRSDGPDTVAPATNFTREWVLWNSRVGECNGMTPPSGGSYAVSKSWTDFVFHLPTREDLERHWQENFPKVARPLLKVINCPFAADVGSVVCCACLNSVCRCLRRKKMAWLPPKVLPTGHGFKLVSHRRKV